MIEIPYIDKKDVFSINPGKELLKMNEKLIAQVYYCLNWKKKAKPGKIKGRSEVRGGGRKPWKQKGTGKARAGTIRSPLFIGGGVIFGPSGEKGTKRITKKMKGKAMGQLYVNKIKSKEIFIVDKIEVKGNKTKEANKVFRDRIKPIVLVFDKAESSRLIPYRNISYITPAYFESIDMSDIFSKKEIIFTNKSVEKLKSFLEKHNEIS